MSIKLVEKQIQKSELQDLANERYGDLVKAVVDVERRVMMVGGELHADEEALLLEHGSRQRDLWGINIRLEKIDDEFVEFDSVINLRPSHGNFTRGVNDPVIRQKIKEIVKDLVKS